MATDCIAQVTFQGEGFAKPIVARFDQPDASTDGGLLLLKALDTQLGLTARLAACLDDARDPGKVVHETIDLLQQRLFGLCAGYADCNDAARLVHDPIHKLLVGRDPLTGLGPGLAAHAVAVRERRERARVARHDARAGRHRDRAAAAPVARARHPDHDRPGSHRRPHARPAGVRVLQRALRHLVLPAGGRHRDVQRRAGAVCGGRGPRPGKAPAGLGARGILRALLRKLRPAFPAATFRVRLDGGFASPKLFLFLRAGVRVTSRACASAGAAMRGMSSGGEQQMLATRPGADGPSAADAPRRAVDGTRPHAGAPISSRSSRRMNREERAWPSCWWSRTPRALRRPATPTSWRTAGCVLDGDGANIAENDDIKEFYLGPRRQSGDGRATAT